MTGWSWMAALAAMSMAASAAAQTTRTAPETRVEREGPRDRVIVDFPESAFEEERRITRIVEELYGPGATASGGGRVSEEVEAALQAGRPLPAGANERRVEPRLAERLPAGVRWVAVGEHLVGLDSDGRISRVYHDILP